jgi:hypothetical protein
VPGRDAAHFDSANEPLGILGEAACRAPPATAVKFSQELLFKAKKRVRGYRSGGPQCPGSYLSSVPIFFRSAVVMLKSSARFIAACALQARVSIYVRMKFREDDAVSMRLSAH